MSQNLFKLPKKNQGDLLNGFLIYAVPEEVDKNSMSRAIICTVAGKPRGVEVLLLYERCYHLSWQTGKGDPPRRPRQAPHAPMIDPSTLRVRCGYSSVPYSWGDTRGFPYHGNTLHWATTVRKMALAARFQNGGLALLIAHHVSVCWL